jgi:hypothetical protein
MATGDAELVQDVTHVRVDRPLGDAKLGGDLRIGEFPRDQSRDRLLTGRQLRYPVVREPGIREGERLREGGIH